MCVGRLLIISGRWKNHEAVAVPDTERVDELGVISVLIQLRNRLGNKIFIRTVKDNLMGLGRFRFKVGEKVVVSDRDHHVEGIGVVLHRRSDVNRDGDRLNFYTVNWGTDDNREEVEYSENDLGFPPPRIIREKKE